jgi:branched-chain amino acid transport system ATP-binding protein
MKQPILQVMEIHSGYDGIPVIHGVSLDVHQGELVAIVGANGAGKTTTMRTISGLMKPYKGQISFNGKDITSLSAHEKMKLGLSYVPEGRRLFAKLSVKENLELGAYILKDREQVQERLEEVFDLFPRLKDRSCQTAETLSGGEQQMLAIARGLMSKPLLLMLDEMSLGLMPSLVEKVMGAIVRINRAGMTVLIVEQMVQEALEISSRGYILQTGKIIRSGDSAQLLSSDDVRKAYMGL